ncbi:MAG: hypothetical protein ACI89L_002222 [Phycisphaerales bacterium]
MTPLWLAIPMITLCVCSAAFAAYWTIASYRIGRAFSSLPTAQDGVGLAPPNLSVCVIVPAHNEAGHIAHLVESLRAQTHEQFSVVLALDRCTDETEAVAREAIGDDPRFEIVPIAECPDDWAGKVHAAHTGYTRSGRAQSADLLLFTDADCTFAPEALNATAALLESRGLDLLSLFSSLGTRRWFEKLAQPAAGFELGRWFPLTRANAKKGQLPKRPFANGQFMLFRAAAYRALGGHGAQEIRAALLEDVAFATQYGTARRPTGLLLADGVVRCRMYETWAEFRRGWKRIYTESANRKPDRLAKAAMQLRMMSTLPLLAAVCFALAWLVPWEDQPLAGLALGLPMLGTLSWAYALIRVQRGTHAPIWMIPLWPIGGWLVAGILAEAARDLRKGVPTRWGGKDYIREAR